MLNKGIRLSILKKRSRVQFFKEENNFFSLYEWKSRDIMYKYIGIGIVISTLYLLQINFASFRKEEMLAGLLAVIAVGLFGVIWQKETKSNRINSVVGISIFVFFVFFFLSDNMLVGGEKMTAIALSFIVAGVFGLLKRHNN